MRRERAKPEQQDQEEPRCPTRRTNELRSRRALQSEPATASLLKAVRAHLDKSPGKTIVKTVGQADEGGLRRLDPGCWSAPEAMRRVVPGVRKAVHSNRTTKRTDGAGGAHVEHRMHKPLSTAFALGGRLSECSGPRDEGGVAAVVVSVTHPERRKESREIRSTLPSVAQPRQAGGKAKSRGSGKGKGEELSGRDRKAMRFRTRYGTCASPSPTPDLNHGRKEGA